MKILSLILLLVFGGAACSLLPTKAEKTESKYTPWEQITAPATESQATAYTAAQLVGNITSPNLHEISGLTASRKTPEILWMHNDSGDKAQIFAVNLQGKVIAQLAVPEAQNEDWEDIASGPGNNGQAALYLADVGDNERKRAFVTIYRIPEPILSGQKITKTAAAESFRFRYPDGSHDCEAVFVNPQNGQVYLITKTMREDCAVYRLPVPLPRDQIVVAEKVTGKNISRIERLRLVTAADMSPDGTRLVIRTYFGAFEFVRAKKAPFDTIFDQEPASLTLPLMKQSEAIAYDAAGKSIFVTSEKLPAPLYRLNQK